MAKAAFSGVSYNGLYTYLQSNNSSYCIIPEEYEHGKCYLVFESIDDVEYGWTPILRCDYLKQAREFVMEKEAEVIA